MLALPQNLEYRILERHAILNFEMGYPLNWLQFCRTQKNMARTAKEFQGKHLNLRIKGTLFCFCFFSIILSIFLSRTISLSTNLLSAAMKYAMTQWSLIKTLFCPAGLQTVALGTPIPRATSCHNSHNPGPTNPDFENGLDGWTVVSGSAFGPASVSSETSYWGG